MECKHKWEIKEEHEGTRRSFFSGWHRNKVFILRCKICGDIKQKWTELPYLKKKHKKVSKR